MVLLLPRAKSTSERFLEALGTGVQAGADYFQKEKQQIQLNNENQAAKRMGIDLSGFNHPEDRRKIMEYALRGKELEKEYGFKENLEKEKIKEKYKNKQSLMEGIGETYGQTEDTQVDEMSPHEKYPGVGLLDGIIEKKQAKEKTGKPRFKLPHSPKDIGKMAIADPTTARIWESQNEAALRHQEHQENIDIKKQERIEDKAQKEKEFFHKETEKYDTELSELSTAAQKKNRALERQMNSVDKLGWFDRVSTAVFGNTPYGNLLKSQTAQEFDANTLPQLEGQRQILGGILSDSDIRLLMQKIVTADKNPEANKTIARQMQLENDLVINKEQIAEEIKRKNGGYRPANYLSEINRIYNERYGKDIQDSYQNVMALADDAKKLGNIGRRKVPPGTPITDQIVEMYGAIAKGNWQEAERLAREDGYDFPE